MGSTLLFPHKPYVLSAAAIGGFAEGEGPLGSCFDRVLEDDRLGEPTFEKGEKRLLMETCRLCLSKAGLEEEHCGCFLCGDLLNQIISSSFAAREMGIPYLGLYGACSTMTEGLLLGGALVDGGYRDTALCAAVSHFSTAERQYRYPLEMGTTTPPSAQRTVTGAGAVLLGRNLQKKALFSRVRLVSATIGKVVDLGITDSSNMGAAMAPAAYHAICAHLLNTRSNAEDFDAICTGDLGRFGKQMLLELFEESCVDVSKKLFDCGEEIYAPEQNYHCGGSGCGCSASVLAGYVLPRLEEGRWHNVLFLSTGALMSPLTCNQGESIPGIAHVIQLSRED